MPKRVITVDPVFVTRQEDLEKAGEAFLRATVVALDIETAPSGTRGGPLPSCGVIRTIQVAVGGRYKPRQLVIDCFKVDPRAFLEKLCTTERTIIAHNARYEVAWLMWHYGIVIPKVFDTMVAWRLIKKSRTGRHAKLPCAFSIGLAPLLENEIKFPIDKAEQMGDWAVPQLTDNQIRYAATDVAYLPRLMSMTKYRLRQEGISERIVDLEMRRVSISTIKSTEAHPRRTADHYPEMLETVRQCDSVEELEFFWRHRWERPIYWRRREALEMCYRERHAELNPMIDALNMTREEIECAQQRMVDSAAQEENLKEISESGSSHTFDNGLI